MIKYYSLAVKNEEAHIYIYGDIVSWEWFESDVSSYTLSKEIESLDDEVKMINVYINSYGGEVAEALAICSALNRHKAKVKTYCDGFACSAAANIFMAGEERIMSNASLLFVHHVWTWAAGNANQLRKTADDIEKMTQAANNLYLGKVNISEEELLKMLDEETWLLPEEALEMGFATSIVSDGKNKAASQSVKKSLIKIIAEQKVFQQVNKQNSEPPEPPDPPEPPAPEPRPQQNNPKNLMAALFR